MTATDRDARESVIAAIEANGTTVASRDEYDIDAIVSECYDVAGSFDVQSVDHDTFWAIVARNEH